MLIAWLGHSTMGFLDDCFQVPKESNRSGITPGAELQNVANHLPSDVFLETPAWVPSKHEVLKPRTVGTIQLYQHVSQTRRRLARERKRCFSSSSEDGNRKK